MFIQLDTRNNDGLTVSLEWDRDTNATRIVVDDVRNAGMHVVGMSAANAADAFRHPFRYVP